MVIRVGELSKRYGSILALDRLSLEVPAGAVFGLLGPNGAGKTTLFRLVMGFVLPDGGWIDRGGLHPSSIGYLPERAFYPSRFRVRKYLTTVGRLAGLRGSALRGSVEQLLLQLDLKEVANQRLGACSRGILQRLGLAQALIGDPPLLVLDEPARGLDPAGQRFMRDRILALHQAGKTVILSSHHLDEVARVCTHVGVLNRGRLVRSDPLETLLAPRPQLAVTPGPGGSSDFWQVTITTGPMPAELSSKLTSLGAGIAVTGRWVTLTGEAIAQKARVLRLLLDAEVDVQRIGERHFTLEDVFMTGE